jgi:uncharacterized membrane protein YkvA (DUF1232 family)
VNWSWWAALVALVAGLALLWLALVVALWRNRPERMQAGEMVRLLPDLLRLLKRLAADSTLPRGVRWRLWLVLAYLAMPIDLVPDFIPVLGYADDAIVLALALRSVARRAGQSAVARHWPGTPEGLAAVFRLAGVRAAL